MQNQAGEIRPSVAVVGMMTIALLATLVGASDANATADASNSTASALGGDVELGSASLSALFADLTPLDILVLTLVLFVIAALLTYLFRQRQRSRARIRAVRDADRVYAQQRIDLQSIPI